MANCAFQLKTKQFNNEEIIQKIYFKAFKSLWYYQELLKNTGKITNLLIHLMKLGYCTHRLKPIAAALDMQLH